MVAVENCEGCGGSGVRAPATPSCHIAGVQQGWMVVERCDLCQIFPDDLSAAHVVSTGARWMRCEDEGWHVIAQCL